MHLLRRTTTVATLFAGLILTAACQSTDDQPMLGQAVESSTGPSETTSSPSPTHPPAWQAKYTKKEVAAYEAALDRFAVYEERSEPIWRRGRATTAAQHLFKQYFIEGYWQTQLSRLRIYEQAEVSVAGLPKVLWSRAAHISRATVRIRQCVDYRPMTTTQYGEPTRPVKSRERPVTRLVALSKNQGNPWQIYEIVTKPGNKDRPCTARS
jgi:hypothetical protein